MLSRLGPAWGTFGAWRRGQPRTTPVSCGTFRLTVHLGERPWAALRQTPYRPWHTRGQGLEAPLASGSRWAATDRRRKQHDRWKSVTDRRITQALPPALTFGFLTIIHDP